MSRRRKYFEVPRVGIKKIGLNAEKKFVHENLHHAPPPPQMINGRPLSWIFASVREWT